MNIQMATSEFKNVLSIMDKIKSKNNFQVFQVTDLKIISGNNETQFIKSNTQTTIIIKNSNTVNIESGEILLQNETAETIKKIKENYITITDDKILTDKKKISFKQIENIKINTYDIMPKIFEVTQKELLRMLEVDYAVSGDDLKPILTGVYFNQNETCACDGYRLSIRRTREYENEYKFTINSVSEGILKSLLKANSNDIVNVYYEDDIVKFEIGNISVIAQCLQGEFLNYKQIVPTDYDSICNFDSTELLDEIEFIVAADGRPFLKTIFTEDKIILQGSQCKEQYSEELSYEDQEKRQKELDADYKVKYDLWISKKKKGKEPVKKVAKFKKQSELIPVSDIVCEVDSDNVLKGRSTVDNTFTIGYNPNFMIDALKLYKDKIEVKMGSSIAPIIISNNTDKGLELLLPVRLRSEV